jgi:hypothetical protein
MYGGKENWEKMERGERVHVALVCMDKVLMVGPTHLP